jgi:hypothetical protein
MERLPSAATRLHIFRQPSSLYSIYVFPIALAARLFPSIDMPVQSYSSGMSVRLGGRRGHAFDTSFEIVKKPSAQ